GLATITISYRISAMNSIPRKADGAMQSAALVIFFCWASFLLLLSFAPPKWLHPAGRAVEHLGQFGDAFAPVTAFFAMYAALFAWQSYQAQRQQLEDERSKTRTDRFDELFFRLLGYYDQQMAAVLRTVRRHGGGVDEYTGHREVNLLHR